MNRNRIALAAPAAVVVAVALMLLRLHFEPPTVPEYRIARATPAAAGGEARLARDDTFALELAPVVPVTGVVAARGFLLRGDDVRPWGPRFTVAADGTVRVAGTVGALFAGVSGGAWDVAVAVGRPETLPTLPREVLHAREAHHDDDRAAWRLVTERVRLE